MRVQNCTSSCFFSSHLYSSLLSFQTNLLTRPSENSATLSYLFIFIQQLLYLFITLDEGAPLDSCSLEESQMSSKTTNEKKFCWKRFMFPDIKRVARGLWVLVLTVSNLEASTPRGTSEAQWADTSSHLCVFLLCSSCVACCHHILRRAC